MRILSFDVSSSTIGYGVLDIVGNKIRLFDSGFYKPPKDGNLFERLQQTISNIEIILEKYKPDEVAIEDIIKFMPKNSSANTIITLALFNRLVGLTCWKVTNKEPHMFTVMDIRHGLKVSPELPAKEEMPELINRHLKIKLKAEMKKTGKPKDEYYDEADGIAVGLYYAFSLTNRLDNLKKKKKIKK